MGKKKESTIVIQQSPSGSYSEKDFELRMQKRDLRKMRRRVNRTFARFNNIITTIILGIILALIIVSVLKLDDNLQGFLVSLLVCVLFLNIFMSNVHNLTLLFQEDKFYDFGNLTIASINIILMLTIILMIIIAFIFTFSNITMPQLQPVKEASGVFVSIMGSCSRTLLGGFKHVFICNPKK
tara:strand:+ start:8356 stop:8901 length:546 start_codon:yes stop_codon:yes gene_type:complete